MDLVTGQGSTLSDLDDHNRIDKAAWLTRVFVAHFHETVGELDLVGLLPIVYSPILVGVILTNEPAKAIVRLLRAHSKAPRILLYRHFFGLLVVDPDIVGNFEPVLLG